MNKKSYLGTVVLTMVLALIASNSVFADGSRKVVLRYDMMLQGTQLAQGEYTINWVSHSPETTVTLAKKSNMVATAQGRMVNASKKFDQNAVLFDEGPNGARVIREIRLAGSNQAIVFDD